MIAGLRARAATIGDQAATGARDRIAARIADDVPGVTAAIDDDRIVVTGRGLRARLLSEPALRWIGSFGR
ncbi:hypothetical protein DFR49_3757 [Hephaestia caeni]|uniref:Uncharacterized protein n=1 Tax=Hephaestia caeni TaxID=645617 RepID=A0A397NN89_9SPHN|nr:hypothetical protein [Hephaestia caeni]RIA37868.1 hypothetical protein DFR49_3757 [Hephaestia caeni]